MYDISMVGIIIKKKRIESHISQESLSEKVDITPTHLKHIESGHRKPSVEVLFRIFNELNISFEELKEPTDEDCNAEKSAVNSILDRCTKAELCTVRKLIAFVMENFNIK